MKQAALSTLRHGDQDRTALRSNSAHRKQMYRLMLEPFRFPDETGTLRFIEGTWGEQISRTASALDFPTPGIPALRLDTDTRVYHEEFISLHEVGMGGAPCALHSGHHQRDRMRTLEEVVRYYRYFDYVPQRTPDRFPDHLTFELEFMAHLIECQIEAETLQGDVLSPLRAQSDFAQRHLAGWLPGLDAQVTGRSNLSFCKRVTQLLNQFVAYDAGLLGDQLRLIDTNHGGHPDG